MMYARLSRLSLSDEITDIYESNKQTDYENRKKEEWKNDLERLIHRQFPNLRLVLAGSSTSGFATRGSDCDFALIKKSTSDNTYRSGISVLQDVEKVLKSEDRKNSLVTELIPLAVVPILILKDRTRGLEGDICYDVHNGIYNTFLVRCYANMDSRVRPIAIAVKTWAQRNHIVNAKEHKLSGFAVVLLVLHYLQHGCSPPVLPSLQQKYPSYFRERDPNLVADWLEQKYIPPVISQHESANCNSAEILFKGFFRYYNSFDWDRVISVRTGSFTPLPYAKKWTKPHIRIEDPSDNTNVTKAVYERYGFGVIRQAITAANQKFDRGVKIRDVVS